MSLNYGFIVKVAATHCPPPARLLDFGCGGGEVVELALRSGFDSWGVDSFDNGWGGIYGHAADKQDGRIIRISARERLPFDNASFDVVVTNQVFEHLRDPEPAVGEIARVLRPKGILVAMFPTSEIIVEPHIRAPFVHWFRTGSPAQERALRLSHKLGFSNDPRRVRDDWAKAELETLRGGVFYRNEDDILTTFSRGFELVCRGEADFIIDRVRNNRALRRFHPYLAWSIFEPLLRWACVRLAGVVLVLRRAEHWP
jgi:SAM-dependent methyltransferase